MSIDETKKIRKEIDSIDAEIVDCFVRRMKLSEKIGKLKKENNMPVYDAAREKELLDRVSSLCDEEYREYTKSLYHVILSASKDIQEKNNG